MRDKNVRLEKEPDYNNKRRKGIYAIHLTTCIACKYRIPENTDVLQGRVVSCSEYHVRCVRCEWPVAKTHISLEGLCEVCMNSEDRRRYHRQIGKLSERIE
jgi:hypothetical protein